jgi:hypothetical protein
MSVLLQRLSKRDCSSVTQSHRKKLRREKAVVGKRVSAVERESERERGDTDRE